MQVLAETGCYADLTLPAGAFHWAQTSKINSIYECALPLVERAPHRKGRDLARGRAPQVFPVVVQGPLMLDFNVRQWFPAITAHRQCSLDGAESAQASID